MTTPAPSVSAWQDGWFVVPHEVTWQDLDAMGHVNNAVYFSYFEWARTKYWMEMTGASEPSALTFIVARAECDFRRELRMMDLVHIRARVGELRGSSLDFHHEIVRVSDGAVAATARVVVVLFSWETRSKTPISDALRARIAAFQGNAR